MKKSNLEISAWAAAATIAAFGLAACGDDRTGDTASLATSTETAGAMAERTVPGAGVTTAVPARTGSMSSGTRNSDVAAGAPRPGSPGLADAH